MRTLLLVVSLLAVSLASAGCFGETEDEDGLTLEVEEEGWEVTVTDVGGESRTYHVTSSPFKADEDQDGLDDFQERLHRSDPRNPDTDGDGLLDGKNVALEPDDRLVREWKERGIVSNETVEGLIEFQGEFGGPDGSHGGDLLNADTDGDGLSDGLEVGGYDMDVCGVPRFVQTLAHAEDTDGDSIFDGLERDEGLDPMATDTDADGVPDAQDLDPCQDLHIRFRVDAIELGGEGAARALWFQVNLPGEPYISDTVEVERGEEVSTNGFDSPPLDVDDNGADFHRGDYNLTFSVTALTEEGGELARIDLFSRTTGQPSVTGRLEVQDGTLRFADGSWPHGSFQGPEGSVLLRIEPV